MKLHLIHDDNLLSTSITQDLNISDLFSNVKSYLKKENVDYVLLDENSNLLKPEDSIKVSSECDSKMFYLITMPNFKKTVQREPIEMEDIIMKATGSKEKLNKKKTSTSRLQSDRLSFLQALTSNQLGGSRVSQLEQIMALLNNVESLSQPVQVHINTGGSQVGGVIQPGTSSQGGIVFPGLGYPSYQSQPVMPNENHMRSLQEMGFPEDMCRRALIAARNNINRATDILLNDELDYMNDNNNQNEGDLIDVMYDDEMNNNENEGEEHNEENS